MSDTTNVIDNIEFQIKEFIKNGDISRSERDIIIQYPEYNIEITCKPTQNINFLGAEKFKVKIRQNSQMKTSIEEANPDLVAHFIYRQLKETIGEANI